MIINGYTLIGELNNANSGFSKWGFVEKDGKEYFLKELINPVYPVDESVMSREMLNSKRNECLKYEESFERFFRRINGVSRGNLVRIENFFRCGSKYYLITDKISGGVMSPEQVSSLSLEQKLFLIQTAAYCFYDLHSAGIVHADVKPSNILIKKSKSGNYTAKLIDFDSGFIVGETQNEKELGGDLTYLAPETFLAMCGENSEITEKADIFSLGLVFHEYMCGCLPGFDSDEYEYPYEAVLDIGRLDVKANQMPANVAKTITQMLDADPQKRLTASEVLRGLADVNCRCDNGNEYGSIKIGKLTDSYFSVGGDL